MRTFTRVTPSTSTRVIGALGCLPHTTRIGEEFGSLGVSDQKRTGGWSDSPNSGSATSMCSGFSKGLKRFSRCWLMVSLWMRISNPSRGSRSARNFSEMSASGTQAGTTPRCFSAAAGGATTEQASKYGVSTFFPLTTSTGRVPAKRAVSSARVMAGARPASDGRACKRRAVRPRPSGRHAPIENDGHLNSGAVNVGLGASASGGHRRHSAAAVH